jgi:hypothetical protein
MHVMRKICRYITLRTFGAEPSVRDLRSGNHRRNDFCDSKLQAGSCDMQCVSTRRCMRPSIQLPFLWHASRSNMNTLNSVRFRTTVRWVARSGGGSMRSYRKWQNLRSSCEVRDKTCNVQLTFSADMSICSVTCGDKAQRPQLKLNKTKRGETFDFELERRSLSAASDRRAIL